jgi:acyl-CoA thioesterase I
MAKGLIVAGLGDSTTAGTPGFYSPVEVPPRGWGNAESQYSYWMMKAHPEWTVLNRGVNGERTDQILDRFTQDVIKEKANVVIVLGGVNDIYQSRPLDTVKRNLEAMYALAKKNGIVPVAATVLPYDTSSKEEAGDIRAINKWIETSSNAAGRLFCDTNLAVRDKKNPDRLAATPDKIHPDVEGYKRMGVALTETLERAGY